MSKVKAFRARARALSLPACLWTAFICLFMLKAGAPALAQQRHSSDRGVPAESKAGQAGASTYARAWRSRPWPR